MNDSGGAFDCVDGPKILVLPVINSPDCAILDNLVFENFILGDEPFAKALRNFETCVSVNNNLCRKLVSPLELPIKFNKSYFSSFLLQILTY